LSAPRRAPRRQVDGVILLDKPLGLSSNQALQTVRRLYNAEKAGHTGTLDPLATGLLPLCFGEATKFSGELLNADKRYLARIKLGIETDTCDAEGRVLVERPVNSTENEVQIALKQFVGDIEQIPPMYSALKRDGKPLYEYARAGIELERAPRQITIFSLNLLAWNPEPDSLDVEVHCSKGTYVRTLALDIGRRLGCGAHLSALRRTAIGRLSIADTHSLEQIESFVDVGRDALLQSVDSLIAELPEVVLTNEDSRKILHGQPIRCSRTHAVDQPAAAYRVRLYSPERKFLGVGLLDEDGGLKPERLRAS
jgi:tRNA pseudouridine55 synthase